MGADIHIYLEKYNKEDGEWEYFTIYDYCKEPVNDYHRDYDLFGMLGGVRGDTNTYTKMCRGLPVDISPEVAEEYEKWSGDCHSVTWYFYDELVCMLEHLKLLVKEKILDNKNYEECLEAIQLYKTLRCFINFIDIIREINFAQYSPTRIIIWFDN